MIREHKRLHDEIDSLLSSVKDSNNNFLIFSLKYLEEKEFCAFEIIISDQNNVSNVVISNKILHNIRKSNFVSQIYMLDNHRTFVVHLLPLKVIRKNKLNKIKNKLELIA